MSLRLRLTLWYSCLLAGLLLLILVMAVSNVRASVLGDIDSDLRTRGGEISRLVEGGLVSAPIARAIVAIDPVLGSNTYVQFRDLNRRVIYRSTNLVNQLIALPEAYYQQALQGASGYYSVPPDGPDELRVYFAPIAFGGETVGILQVGRSLTPEQAVLRRLTISLVVLILAALAVGASVGYWLAGRALWPIETATTTALAITRTGRLDRRVPIDSARNDEIGRLVGTFNEMLDHLQQLFGKQKRFSADVSHELRSPLTTILGNVNLLKRAAKLPPAEQQDMLNEIEAEAERMRRLIADLLLLAQADAGLVLARERIELDTLLLDVYRQARRRAAQLDIRLLHEDQAIVLGDADRLRQVLENLVNNAIQYTPAGGHIDLGLECTKEWAEITVADTGHGIAPDDLPYIFDRFYRTDKARSRAAGGTGLGLSIVKWIVDAHQGEIEVTSELGVGTKFRVRLPLPSSS